MKKIGLLILALSLFSLSSQAQQKDNAAIAFDTYVFEAPSGKQTSIQLKQGTKIRASSTQKVPGWNKIAFKEGDKTLTGYIETENIEFLNATPEAKETSSTPRIASSLLSYTYMPLKGSTYLDTAYESTVIRSTTYSGNTATTAIATTKYDSSVFRIDAQRAVGENISIGLRLRYLIEEKQSTATLATLGTPTNSEAKYTGLMDPIFLYRMSLVQTQNDSVQVFANLSLPVIEARAPVQSATITSSSIDSKTTSPGSGGTGAFTYLLGSQYIRKLDSFEAGVSVDYDRVNERTIKTASGSAKAAGSTVITPALKAKYLAKSFSIGPVYKHRFIKFDSLNGTNPLGYNFGTFMLVADYLINPKMAVRLSYETLLTALNPSELFASDSEKKDPKSKKTETEFNPYDGLTVTYQSYQILGLNFLYEF